MFQDHNGEECQLDECKYLTDYLALKFNPETPGGYIVNFINKINGQLLASSPYKLIVHENLKEIVKSSGIYDVTRLTIIASYLPDPYEFNDLKIEVYGLFVCCCLCSLLNSTFNMFILIVILFFFLKHRSK